MARPYQPILGTLIYLVDTRTDCVLMMHRDTRTDDEHYGKYNGLGGKVESNEDITSSAIREVKEESGLTCEALDLRGTISWPGFGAKGEDWFGFIFLCKKFSGTVIPACPEGHLHWIPMSKLMTLNMWEGDRHFLPLVFDRNPEAFHGVMPYEHGRPTDWRFSRQ